MRWRRKSNDALGSSRLVRLEIEPVIARTEVLVAQIENELPTHPGLARVARAVAQSAREARNLSLWQKRMWSLHRLPALFLAVSLILFGFWIYWNFIRVARLKIGVPDRDATSLHESLASSQLRLEFVEVLTKGSKDGIQRLENGELDLAFVQGGVEIPPELPRREAPSREMVLLLLRPGIESPNSIRTLLTSDREQGSHTIAQQFARIWRIDSEVKYVHEWTQLSEEETYEVPAAVDAVLVIKDPADEKTWRGVERLVDAGFRFASPDIGARGHALRYLRPAEIPPGFFRLPSPRVPEEPLPTYTVATYVVARADLTPRLMAAASDLLEQRNVFAERGFEPNFSDASEMLQGLDSFLSILIYISLAFLALLGLETLLYRRRFDELNTLVSLISIHQSARDVLGVRDPEVLRDNLLYLRKCSDLLGLIGVITGYYTQENSSLLYNNLIQTIHERSSSLKVNIQLKVLHASIDASRFGVRPEEVLSDDLSAGAQGATVAE